MKKNILLSITSLTLASMLIVSGVEAFPQNQQGKTPPKAEASKGEATSGVISGKVVETMDVSGYTYVCLEKNGKKTWVAAPKMKVKKGQTMSFKPGMEMVNFESKTLNRKFDRIIFTDGVVK